MTGGEVFRQFSGAWRKTFRAFRNTSNDRRASSGASSNRQASSNRHFDRSCMVLSRGRVEKRPHSAFRSTRRIARVSALTRRGLLAAALVAAAIPLLVVMACGPDFEPEVFTPATHPEDLKTYASGNLGVLQPNYWQADKIVAYRYLIGGHLSPAEQAVYNPPPPPEPLPMSYQAVYQAGQRAMEAKQPANRWVAARAGFTQQPLAAAPAADRTVEIKRQGSVEQEYQLNCPGDAFETAIATLRSRATAWGPQSAALKDWIAGQDAVFSNCAQSGTQPLPAPADAPPLLHQDRAYQLAAAHLYAARYDEAVTAFEAIAQDRSSPWSKWGEYLAARAEVRKAAAIAPAGGWGDQAQFDPALLRSAQVRLRQVAQTAQTFDPKMQHAALAELSFINLRLDPKAHMNEAATALAGPAPDPEFSRNLDDLRFLADHKMTGDTDLLRWMGLAGQPEDGAANQSGNLAGSAPPVPAATQPGAYQRWRSTPSNPWLLSALALAEPGSSEASTLLAAAAKLPAGSPAYATANYHRVDLLLRAGQREPARLLATTLLEALHGPGMTGSRNAVLALRMLTAPTFSAFLEDAPRTVVASDFTSEAATNVPCRNSPTSAYCSKGISAAQLDQDAASAFNRKLPLALWIEAANSRTLPENLRQAVAWAAWVRALGLNDEASTRQLAPLLPPAVRAAVASSTGWAATVALLRNPGLRPYLDQGVQRSASYSTQDEYRDNWWCDRWGDGAKPVAQSPPAVVPPDAALSFLEPAQQEAAKTQTAALNQLPNGVTWLGRRAIDYVKAHPEEPAAAESLALTVRATRFGCFIPPDKAAPQKAVSKEAFDLLHQRYPKSSWAAKTPYYY